MINVVKLIIINFLGLFDFNKVLIARDSGIKNTNEKKIIIFGVISFILIYIMNTILKTFDFNNPLNIFIIGFIICTLISFIIDGFLVDSTIFQSNDMDLLFSLPLSKNEIIYSKLFSVLIKNIVLNILVMLICAIRYSSYSSINQSLGLMIIMSTLFISVLPIIIVSVFSYLLNYFKYRFNKFINFIIKIMTIFVIGSVIYFIYNSSDKLKLISYIYPMMLLFKVMIYNDNNFVFLLYMIINIVIGFIYSYFISDNYLKICSLLKGVKTNNRFIMTRMSNFKSIMGYVRKDLRYLFNNKVYLLNVIYFRLGCSIVLTLIFIIVPYSKIANINELDYYLNNLVVPILCTICMFNSFNICSLSMEKENINIVKTLPISMKKVLFSKIISGIILGGVFVIYNGIISCIYFNPDIFLKIMYFVMPFSFVIFLETFSLALDYRFIIKNENNDNVITKERIIGYVPLFISLFITVSAVLTLGIGYYKVYLLGLTSIFLLLTLGTLLYLVINRKRLYNLLIN